MTGDCGVLPTAIPGLHVLYEYSPDRRTLTLHSVRTEQPEQPSATIWTLADGSPSHNS